MFSFVTSLSQLLSFSLLVTHTSENRNYDELTIDDILCDVCGFLKFADDASDKLKRKARDFFEDESRLSSHGIAHSELCKPLREERTSYTAVKVAQTTLSEDIQ